jgi:hypothetical protein
VVAGEPSQDSDCSGCVGDVYQDWPRSWPREDKVRFAELDPDIREIISKRENDRDKELRRLQNKVAADLQRQTATAPEAKPVADIEDKSNDDQKT